MPEAASIISRVCKAKSIHVTASGCKEIRHLIKQHHEKNPHPLRKPEKHKSPPLR
jgi:hypothetical protein